MSLVSDLINRALILINAVTQGQSLNSSEYDDALARLNLIIDQWNADPLAHYAIASTSYTLTAAVGSYTLGTGGSLTTTRPVLIQAAKIILSGLTHPMDLITKAEYDGILERGVQATVPRKLYDDGGFPTRTIKLWPVPSGAPDIEIDSPLIIQQFAALNSPVSLPPAYEKALMYALAIDSAPSFQVPLDQTVIAVGQQAKQDMMKPTVLTQTPALAPGPITGVQNRGTANPGASA